MSSPVTPTHRAQPELLMPHGDAPKDVPEVVFLCGHNAGRSQTAAALLTHRAQGRVHVRSAGPAPTDSINPTVVAAMADACPVLLRGLTAPILGRAQLAALTATPTPATPTSA